MVVFGENRPVFGASFCCTFIDGYCLGRYTKVVDTGLVRSDVYKPFEKR
jgi:hypothetical protein